MFFLLTQWVTTWIECPILYRTLSKTTFVQVILCFVQLHQKIWFECAFDFVRLCTIIYSKQLLLISRRFGSLRWILSNWAYHAWCLAGDNSIDNRQNRQTYIVIERELEHANEQTCTTGCAGIATFCMQLDVYNINHVLEIK